MAIISRISFVLLLLSAAAATLNAQQAEPKSFDISGIIEDQNGEAVSGASVTASNLNQSQKTQSDSEGNYQLKNLQAGIYLLEINNGDFIAHQQIAVNPKNLEHNIAINTSANELGEVHLQAESLKSKMEKKGFALNVVETGEASIRNIQTNELLNTTVGVKIRQNGGLGSRAEYSLNGLSGSSVSIFIDGIPVSIYGSSFSLNSIPPSMIKRIEVYKGVVPGHLTDDALGGAINIVLHKDANSNLNASVSYGSFNTFQASANGLYRFKKSGFTVKASGFHNYSDNDYKVWGRKVKHIEIDGSQTPITARRFNDAYRSTGGMVQVGYTDVKWADQFLIGLTGSDDYKEIQHGAFMTLHPYNGRFMESDATLANLTFQKKDLFIPGLELNVNGLYGKRNRIINDTVAQAYTWRGVKMQRMDSGEIIYHEYSWGSQQESGPTLNTIERNVASLRTGLSYAINTHHKLLFNHAYSGLDREDSDELKTLLENTFQQTSDLYKNIYSFSYELTVFKDKLKVNLFDKYYHQKVSNTRPVFQDNADGTRSVVDEVYNSDQKYNGFGAALSYAILPNITLLTSAERAIRLPNETEVFGDVGDNVVENLTIEPEISNNYNLGFRFGNFNIQKHQFTIGANVFARNIKNRIALPINADGLRESNEVVQYANFDEHTTSRGIEAQINYSYNNLRLNFNLSRLRLKTKNREGLTVDVPNTPLFTMNTGLRYSIKNVIQKNAALDLFYTAYFTDKFLYQNPPGNNNTGLEHFQVPEQLAQDFGLSYSFPNQNFVMSFDVKNIFNKPVYDNLSVQKPGRAFYLKLNYSINKF